MTDYDCKEQPLESDLNLSPSDRDFVLRLLDVAERSRVSLISEPDLEERPNDRASPISSASDLQSRTEEDDSSDQSSDSITESAKLISELCEILGQSLPQTSHTALLTPGTPPTPSVYRSITPETSSSFCDPLITDYPDYSPTSERTIRARPSSASSYQALIGRYSSDWGYESTGQNLPDYPKNWPLREDTALTFPSCQTDKCTPSSSSYIPLSKSCPTSPFTESRSQRRQLTIKVKNRLSKIFGDRTGNL
ncbi:hypothetical protein N7540_012337 [Penicillium herquei]|nr:hypothetical protein N7540_012337 [Penicillium herquei]